MKLKSLAMAVTILVVLFGGISISSAMGLWKTSSTKVPATYKNGEFAGMYNPADIRGSYTFNDIFRAFDVPVEDLGKAFGVQDPERYAAFQCKELEALYAPLAAEGKEVGTGSVRYFVALYKGLPIELGEPTYLPVPAVDILKANAKLTDEQIKNIEKYSVALPPISAAGSASTSSSSSTLPSSSQASSASKAPVTEKSVSEKTIKGTTTFKELLDWGVRKEDIEKTINDKMPDSGRIIKDYASTKGVEFSTIKEPLQKLVDTVK